MICLTIMQKETDADRERKKRIRINRKIRAAKLIIWSLFTGFCIGITPYCFYYAELQRGYAGAIGGEYFVPLLPIVLYPLFNGVMNFIKERMIEHEKM